MVSKNNTISTKIFISTQNEPSQYSDVEHVIKGQLGRMYRAMNKHLRNLDNGGYQMIINTNFSLLRCFNTIK